MQHILQRISINCASCYREGRANRHVCDPHWIEHNNSSISIRHNCISACARTCGVTDNDGRASSDDDNAGTDGITDAHTDCSTNAGTDTGAHSSSDGSTSEAIGYQIHNRYLGHIGGKLCAATSETGIRGGASPAAGRH